MADGFGAYTDHFGILAITNGGGTLANILAHAGSDEKVPDAQSRADARDRNGDIAKATWYGNDGNLLSAAQNQFVLKSGELNLSLLKAGEVAVGKFIESIQVSTTNDGWPMITVSGVLGTKAITAPDFPAGALNTWTLPAITIKGAKRAQLLDFTVGAGCDVTAASISGTVSLARQDDGVGEAAAHGASGEVLELSANLVYLDSAPTWTLGDTWEKEVQAVGTGGAPAAHHETSPSAQVVWDRDVSA
jgi:hypothetical protein